MKFILGVAAVLYIAATLYKWALPTPTNNSLGEE